MECFNDIFCHSTSIFNDLLIKKTLHINEAFFAVVSCQLPFSTKPPPKDETIFKINNSLNMKAWTGHTWTDESIDNGQILFLPGC